MPRATRIEFSDAYYHVISRAIPGEMILEERIDRQLFLSTFADAVERFDWLCHAYCLMGNHYHLLVQTRKANLGIGMHQLNARFARSFNARHDRTGYVFQGRYRAILIRRESHFLELARYIVLNPVRAGLASMPEHWEFSSYRATMGLAPVPQFLCVSFLLDIFHLQRQASREAYRHFVMSGLDEAPPLKAGKLDVYIDESDPGQLLVDLETLRDVSDDRVPIETVLDTGAPRGTRNIMIRKAYESGYTVKEISEHCSLHYSTISKLIKAGPGSEIQNFTARPHC